MLFTFVDALPNCYTHSDRIQNFAIGQSQAIIEQSKLEPTTLSIQLGFKDVFIKSIDEPDGLGINLVDERIIHLRPSGNLPELGCYKGADNYLKAIECVNTSLEQNRALQCNWLTLNIKH